mgnify:FL=1
MKILLFGKNGQVGWELQRSLAPLGQLVALNTDNKKLCGDFINLAGIDQTVREVAPDIIVNAAAYTAVDKAESEPERAHTINAQAPGILAQAAKRQKAWLIHYSTDYIFDGSGRNPRVETETVAPLNVYGETKLAGEKLIATSGCAHLIFRTSWVYATHGNNFIKTMLRLAQEQDHLNIINDQIGTPTGAELLADITAHAIRTAQHRPEVSGLYHLAAKGHTSWYGYANFVFEYARTKIPLKIKPDRILPIASNDFPTHAKRPLNSNYKILFL